MTSPDTTTDLDAEPCDDAPRRTWLRLGVLAVILLSLYGIGEVTGMTQHLTQENIQAWMIGAGAWGVLLFIVAFAIGNFLQVPGWVFIGAAVLAYGPVGGIALSIAGGTAAVATSFGIARTVGGKALGRVKNPLMRKLLSRLDARPILYIVLLRAIFMVSPPLNYALAFSRLSWRDYMIGSTLGIIAPISVIGAGMGWFIG